MTREEFRKEHTHYWIRSFHPSKIDQEELNHIATQARKVLGGVPASVWILEGDDPIINYDPYFAFVGE